MSEQDDIKEALVLLRTKRLILAIHDQSFPSKPDEDIGCGSPYTRGGRDFLRFAHWLGFNAVQLGPQGKTTLSNPSPYDGTTFSRNELLISLAQLAEQHWYRLLSPSLLESLVEALPRSTKKDRTQYQYAWHAQWQALRAVYGEFKLRQNDPDLLALKEQFLSWKDAQNRLAGNWLERDGLFELLSLEHGTDDWRTWNADDRDMFYGDYAAAGRAEVLERRMRALQMKYADELELFEFSQFIAHKQQADFRQFTGEMGMRCYGDMHIGYSHRDSWGRVNLFMDDYLMGAPPSRTNPEGQAWNYPILDPRLYFQSNDGDSQRVPGPALMFFRDRARKMLDEFDGVRIDHPHGLVCPWVYKRGDDNALRAVQQGARLFCSPDLPDHSNLAPLAIVETEQINHIVARYADDWVSQLTDEQVREYALLIESVLSLVAERGGNEVFCEVLSTCPYPLRRVLDLYALGRFRITQKVDLGNPGDVYRSENAKPKDVVMVGNHDTKPIWLVIDEWFATGLNTRRAEYLAERLEPNPEKRPDFARSLADDKSKLCHALFADLFACDSESVYIFFSDLLGMKEVFNQPGTINDTNWGLRVPSDYLDEYERKLECGEALSISRSLGMALHARYPQPERSTQMLIERLQSNKNCSS